MSIISFGGNALHKSAGNDLLKVSCLMTKNGLMIWDMGKREYIGIQQISLCDIYSFYGCIAHFVSDLVLNPEYRFSRAVAHIKPY